jgi:hypothetical protein
MASDFFADCEGETVFVTNEAMLHIPEKRMADAAS